MHIKESPFFNIVEKVDIIREIKFSAKGKQFMMMIFPLTHFSPMSHFYTPWKRQKTYGFLTFLEGIEMWHWIKMD